MVMMEIATGLLRCAVMVFMSISFVLSICLFHLVISLVSGSFANVIPTFKNDNRQLKVNCRPVSLLASFSKVCEEVVFFYMYSFSMEIGFLYKLQSGFRPGDSAINQLIFFVHKIYEALESGREVGAVFVDISKAFDKVWHADLLCKSEALGVQLPLLQWFESYLLNRKQRVVIEGQSFHWRTINSGVP